MQVPKTTRKSGIGTWIAKKEYVQIHKTTRKWGIGTEDNEIYLLFQSLHGLRAALSCKITPTVPMTALCCKNLLAQTKGRHLDL